MSSMSLRAVIGVSSALDCFDGSNSSFLLRLSFYVTRIIGILYSQHCNASHVNAVKAYTPTMSQNLGLWL